MNSPSAVAPPAAAATPGKAKTPPGLPFAVVWWLEGRVQKKGQLAAAAREIGLSPKTLAKYHWITTWPDDLKHKAAAHPDVFTARVLLNGFASRRRYWSTNNWARLGRELDVLIEKGAGHRPRKALNYPRSRAGGSLADQRQRQEDQASLPGSRSSLSPDSSAQQPVEFWERLSAQERLRESLSSWVTLSNTEIRIKYCGTEDLHRILALVGPMVSTTPFPGAVDRHVQADFERGTHGQNL